VEEVVVLHSRFSDRERRLVGIDDRLGLIGSLPFVRLHRIHVGLVVRSIAKRRTSHVDL
jgi:hypothetical protein